jgi:hypothetical protein
MNASPGNAFDNASFDERLSAFLDRALTTDEEADLLHILSVSPDKRAALHELLDVRASFAADLAQLTVPTHLDAAVLAAAGLTAAGTAAAVGASSAAATTGAAAGASAAAVAWWTLPRAVAALVAGALLFGAGWLAHIPPSTDITTQHAGEQIASGQGIPHGTSRDGASGMMKDGSAGTTHAAGDAGGDAHRTPPGEAPRTITRTVYVTRVDTVLLPARAMQTAGGQVATRVDTVYVERIERVEVPVAAAPVAAAPVAAVEHPVLRDAAVTPPSWLSHIEVELAREHATTYPYIDFKRLGGEREQQPITALIAWRLSDRHAVGVSGGTRAFAQEYYGMRADSLDMFQQQPTLAWAAGVYRYSLPVTRGVTPQLQVSVGGTDLGPLLGSRLGVAFEPVPHLQFSVGVSAQMLLYRYKDRMFTSQSLGLLYALGYRF